MQNWDGAYLELYHSIMRRPSADDYQDLRKLAEKVSDSYRTLDKAYSLVELLEYKQILEQKSFDDLQLNVR